MALATQQQVASPSVIASMDVTARRQYFASLPPDVATQQRAAYQQYQMQQNRWYMKNTIRKVAVCPQSSGGALSQNYAVGSLLQYTVPSANNAFIEGIELRVNVSLAFATGTSAAYALNAGAPLNLIDTVYVQYNGQQHRIRPLIMKTYEMITGYLCFGVPYAPVAGQTSTYNQSYRSSSTFPVTTGNNTWQFGVYIPFNALHPQDARGLLPAMGGETAVQVNVQCASGLLGPDPILNIAAATTGTGQAITVNSGTVQVLAYYRDGVTMQGPTRLGLDLTDMGTVQYQYDAQLTGLAAGSVYRQKLTILAQHYFTFLYVIDGNQSTKYAANSNFVSIELDQDTVGANQFWKYGTGTNLDVREYFNQLFYFMGQDLDEGIIPIAYAPSYMEPDANDMGGTAYLDTTINGWTDAHYGIQMSSYGTVTGITPRVEVYTIYVNPAGLVQA